MGRASVARAPGNTLPTLTESKAGESPQCEADSKQALKLTYPFTSSYRLAYKHFRLSLSGGVKPADEPKVLLGESINRARETIAKS
ncbi:MAG: hypothetical protein ACREDR_38455, partial [Blastocatellia bacterium]